jgi:hypothetical protein
VTLSGVCHKDRDTIARRKSPPLWQNGNGAAEMWRRDGPKRGEETVSGLSSKRHTESFG